MNYQDRANHWANEYGIPPELFARVINQESRWNPNALSPKGAIGLAQLMPGTAEYLGVDPRDPDQNLQGGARYLSEQYQKFGSWDLALAAYNAGPGAVQKYGGIPPYKETQNYVNIISGDGQSPLNGTASKTGGGLLDPVREKLPDFLTQETPDRKKALAGLLSEMSSEEPLEVTPMVGQPRAQPQPMQRPGAALYQPLRPL